MELVEASKHYPCVKTKWVEYLGEQPDPAIDRVEYTARAAEPHRSSVHDTGARCGRVRAHSPPALEQAA
jgi:hypothetical protein